MHIFLPLSSLSFMDGCQEFIRYRVDRSGFKGFSYGFAWVFYLRGNFFKEHLHDSGRIKIALFVRKQKCAADLINRPDAIERFYAFHPQKFLVKKFEALVVKHVFPEHSQDSFFRKKSAEHRERRGAFRAFTAPCTRVSRGWR